MLAIFLSKLQSDPHFFVYVVVTVVLSITLHELAHGFAALRLGDRTPVTSGHWTWNPVVHMGLPSIVMLLLFGLAFGAMPVDPTRLRGRHAEAIVAIAGPLANLLLAVLAATALAVWQLADDGAGISPWRDNGREFLWVFSVINVVLAMFSMIPVPPLDGATVLASFVRPFREWLRSVREPSTFLWLLAFVLIGLNMLDGGITAPAAQVVNVYLDAVYGLAGR
ncbi:MAG: site-2 protease family protein [Planctomycetes bacterium]|nr:site-2 protease family protein [Planctomycetota bacterium]